MTEERTIEEAFAHAEEGVPVKLPRYQWRMVVGALRTTARQHDAIANRAKHNSTRHTNRKQAQMYRDVANSVDEQRT